MSSSPLSSLVRHGRMLAVSLPLTLLALPGLAADAALKRIEIVHINDVYQVALSDGGSAGLVKMGTLVAKERAGGVPVLTTFGGDGISPSVASTEFKGKQMIDALNSIGFDAAVLGNHEFDFGPALLQTRISESKFPWLAANIKTNATGKLFPGTGDVVIKTVDGVRLALLGVITESTRTSSKPGPDYSFLPAQETACKIAADLRQNNKADVVIALTHLDMSADRLLAQAPNCPVDVILGGHDHDVHQEQVAGKPILKAGSDARNAIVLRLNVDMAAHKLAASDWSLVPLDAKLADDPATRTVSDLYEKDLRARLETVIGNTSLPLDIKTMSVRMQETGTGNLVADAFREEMGADLALVNGGGLRGDQIVPAGPISKLTIKNLLPFENKVSKLEVSGATLQKLMNDIGGPDLGVKPLGRFPSVSGMTVAYVNGTATIRINGQPIDPAKTYSLAAGSFVASGTGQYSALLGAKVLIPEDVQPIETAVVMTYVEKKKTLAYQPEGRMTVKTP